MRVLACGSREWDDSMIVNVVLDGFHAEASAWNTPMVVIHGAARGADSLAGDWAQHSDVAQRVFPADWEKLGKRAGYVRNQKMLDEGNPDIVIAFGHGKGTDMMVDLAKKAGVPTYRVVWEASDDGNGEDA